MIWHRHLPARARRSAGLAVLGALTATIAVVLLVGAAGPAMAARPHATESYARLLRQIQAGQVRTATINKKAHDVKVTLRSGRHELVIYPSRQERQLAARLKTGHARVKVVRHHHAKKTTGHRIRYIVGGVIVVGLVLWGILRLRRGRRRAQRSPPS